MPAGAQLPSDKGKQFDPVQRVTRDVMSIKTVNVRQVGSG